MPRARPRAAWAALFLLLAGCGSRAPGRPGAAAPGDGPPDAATPAPGGAVLPRLPAVIRPESRYLFYLHGAIAEGPNPKPVHPDHGTYELAAILDALASRGFVVVAPLREADADGRAHAQALAADVRRLLDAGVPPEHVAIVGFSKGGGIAVLASSLLADERLPFVLLATCSSWIRQIPDLTLAGRILSLHEGTDTVAGSCRELLAGATIRGTLAEERLELGGGHGAFYRPQAAWVDRTIAWIEAPRPGPAVSVIHGQPDGVAVRFDAQAVTVACPCLPTAPSFRLPDDETHAPPPGSFVHRPPGTAVDGGGGLPTPTATAVPTAEQLARLAELVRARGVLDLPEPQPEAPAEPRWGMDGGGPGPGTSLAVGLDGRARTLSWRSADQWPDPEVREALFTFLGELRRLADETACKPACAAAGRLEEPLRLADPAAGSSSAPLPGEHE